MLLRRKGSELDKDVLLRSYIAQGIKELYLNRKHFFSEESRDYRKLKEILEYISGKINELVSQGPRMLVPSGNGFYYEKLDQRMADEIISFLNFIVELPPPSFKIMARPRKSVDIGMMRIPTLTFILYSTLEFKVPENSLARVNDYACISAAILDVLSESSASSKVREISEKISKRFNGKINNEMKEEYKKNITEWKKLGLLM